MERGLYTAATGMSIAEMTLDVVSNNLANVSTTGFKRDALVFNEALERMLRSGGGGGTEVGELGSGPGPKGVYTIHEMGHLQPTGNLTDVAIGTPDGMFALQTPEGVRFTRNGVFGMNEQGTLVDGHGFPVLDDAQSPIQLPQGLIAVSPIGEISVSGQEVGRIGVFRGTFVKEPSGMFNAADAEAYPDGEAKVHQGYIETSNVNAIEEMVLMIKLNRAFEMAQRSATSQDEATQRLISTLQS